MTVPSPAYAGWLEFFFPSLEKKEPDPSKTLKAPFADPDAVIIAPRAKEGLPDNNTPLNVRHRPSSLIGRWVESALPDILSYRAKEYKKQFKEKTVYFNDVAKAQYIKFMQDSNYIKILETGRYDINAFVVEPPLLMNEGVVEGRYRWLFKSKVMVTHVKSGTKNYKQVKKDDAVTQTMYIITQVGREKDVKNEHGVLIESFSAKIVKEKKKQ